MRLIGYIRVSTDRQAEAGFGLDVQEDALQGWARQQGHRLVRVIREEGVSGALDDRPGLVEAFAALRQREASGVVVPRLDRLARDLIVQEQILAEVRRGGWTVHSATNSESHYLADDPGDPSRTLIRQVLGAVSQYERAMIRLRLAGGRRQKAASGGYAYGAPHFGHRAVGGALVPDGREQAALRRMQALRAAGMSLREIAVALDVEGVAPKRGSRWHPQTVARALSRATAP
ncbi:recombinase family protein [Oryzihumus leptocrescens]|uniref:DNA invertase Pin-like site-specific DNA recombinase n=1 Tax=Oryzihumus leptocrescens TaxID=297536 RepID=A0A542ZEN9_9MICO|nr:recombinase family protein [Oryzihumus leptocrescens]TQL58749.1 DNA invertase Pin-like site-specific DNA recombinase [Oryzihumus leptocrescens]